jgi:4-amino-4-deoxychorismate lyase
VPFTCDPTIASLSKPSSSSSNIVIQGTDGSPTKPLLGPRPIVEVYLDSESTARSLFTETKTTFRDVYDRAKARVSSRVDAGVAMGDWDVLLYSTPSSNVGDKELGKEAIMETSIFNVAFFRSGRWLTPSATHAGCLPGVMRRYLLETNRIEEDHDGELTKNGINVNECVLLFNGVQGCRLGRVCA